MVKIFKEIKGYFYYWNFRSIFLWSALIIWLIFWLFFLLLCIFQDINN